MMQQTVTLLCNLSGANFCGFSCQEWPGKQLLEAYKFCIIIHAFSSALQNGQLWMQYRRTVHAEWGGDYCAFALLNLPLPLCVPSQPHTPGSCSCTVWRKPTTSSHCSSLTQACPPCPTAQRSKFRCASVRRTRCTAALLTPTAPAFLCCSPHSCSPYSVSTIKTTRRKRWELDVTFNFLVYLFKHGFILK